MELAATVNEELIETGFADEPIDARTERLLLDQVRSGCDFAFGRLVLAHSSRTVRLAFRLVGHRDDAEEIAQEAFLRLYRHIGGFRGECRIGTWLYRTVSRLAIDHLRREKLKRRIFFFRQNDEDADPAEVVPDPAASPRDQLLAAESRRRIATALGQLSPRQRTIFILRHREELPLRQIAEILGLEEGTVKAHLHRAVTALRRELGEPPEENR